MSESTAQAPSIEEALREAQVTILELQGEIESKNRELSAKDKTIKDLRDQNTGLLADLHR